MLSCNYATIALCFLAGAVQAADVYAIFEKGGCPGCHNPDGVASGTRLKFPDRDEAKPDLKTFARTLGPLINREKPEESLLLTKPTRRVAHAGGTRIVKGSEDETAVREWIAELAKTVDTAAPATTETAHKSVGPVLRRLTHTQYNNTVRDLLGDDSRVADSFPPEDFVNGFRNQYQSQSVSPLQAEAYATAAEKLAKKAFNGDRSKFMPCKTTDAACRDRYIRDFGRRAFRRPLTAPETARYTRLFTAAGKTSFDDGARMVMEAMLQSPNFLLRTENGLEKTWRPYETASRLSYFLWNTMPDEALFRSAASGELNTPAGVERVSRRMLDDPRAKDSMNEFLAEWLRFDRLTGGVKDRRTYPQFTPELTVSMLEETRRLFAEAAWTKRSFMEFFSADYGFLTADLATLYSVPPPPKDFGRVTFQPATERAGVLGQATFLALTSKPSETSPTARGLFVREQFLCQEVPQPPPGVSTNLPALSKEKPLTNRERLAVHLNSESCSSCHALIDPIGFGFEKFDAIGQRRDKQSITFRPARGERNQESSTVQLDLDTTGNVAGLPNSAFSSPRDLGKILAASAQCQECVVKQLFRYAAGRHETAADRVAIRQAYEDFRKSGFLFRDLLVALSRWVIFPPGGNDGIGTD